MGSNVLIVDDSATMRKVIMRSLRLAGVQNGDLVEAQDGLEGILALEKQSFDLVFSDINMPKMDGYEFVAKVAELMGRNAPPVIVVTTESGEEFTRKVRRMGAKGYLKKPFTVQSMKKAVEPFLK